MVFVGLSESVVVAAESQVLVVGAPDVGVAEVTGELPPEVVEVMAMVAVVFAAVASDVPVPPVAASVELLSSLLWEASRVAAPRVSRATNARARLPVGSA